MYSGNVKTASTANEYIVTRVSVDRILLKRRAPLDILHAFM